MWLKTRLQASRATWKLIVSGVPMSIATGFPPENGRDGWANGDQNTGFEYELLDLLHFLNDQHITNSVWITTDVHFAAGLRYQPFPTQPQFTVYEFTSGPLSAIVLPPSASGFDDTLHPTRLFTFGPADFTTITSFAEAKGFFNFGVGQIDTSGQLTISIVNAYGATVFTTTLPPP